MPKLRFAALGLLLPGLLIAADPPYSPKIAPASDEAAKAMQGMRIPDKLRVQLVAAEPLLANPVAFCFDERGRIFVAETFRQKNAVVDNRDYMHWLDDDLAAMTIEDRLAYHQKHLKEKLVEFTKEHDRIRLLEDRDGDGAMETSTVFSDGYNDVLDGTGAGLLARQGTVWYTNIPKLWKLRDTNADGVADEKASLHHGYGVRVAFRGHDLHGLRFGPDGRLYFSIGDRGFNIKTPHRHFVYPEQGAVFRCEPDGSNLEVVHQGLRNPQELAFDQYGNLFTGDNNSDSGDKARWVYVVEGGDSGWRMSFQYLSDRGPWNREKMWHPAWDGQPAFLVPPITNFADGPSGLAYDPGTGLPEKYRERFFLCDFRGGPANSGIRSFASKEKGASFELVDAEQFAWNILATDVDFGPDSAMYITDWVDGWNGEGKGRIYKIDDPASADSSQVKATRALLAEGFEKRSMQELAALLEHPNQQVRQEAQFALAGRGAEAIPLLAASGPASSDRTPIGRLHAIWGLGQIARKPGLSQIALAPVAAMLKDANPHVRRQAAAVLGDVAGRADGASILGAVELLALLKDESPRVRFFAAISAGKAIGPSAVPALLDLVRDNNDSDPYLRHAAVMGLFHACNAQRDVLREPAYYADPLKAAFSDRAPAVRLAVVLVLRRYKRPELSQFLGDVEPRVVEEAARAINDLPVPEAWPALAALAERPRSTEPALWRAINGNFRIGTPESAKRIAALISRDDVPEAIRLEGLRALGDWEKPSGRDRVMGLWRPLEPRAVEPAVEALRSAVASLLAGSGTLRRAAIEVSGKLQLKDAGPTLRQLVADVQQPAETRVEALRALVAIRDERVPDAVDAALESDQPLLRGAARRVLARTQPQAAFQSLREALESGEVLEQQLAFETLGSMPELQADELLVESLKRLKAGNLPAEIQLDLLEAAASRRSDQVKLLLAELDSARPADDPLSAYRESAAGGNPEKGRQIFFEKTSLSCVRCHKIAGQGGEVGPDLSSVGVQQKREYILAALVDPNKDVAKGFETLIVALVTGKVHSGIVKASDDKTLKLMTPDAAIITIDRSEIDEELKGKSSMPEDLVKKMSKRELRDLVEFLVNQKSPPAK